MYGRLRDQADRYRSELVSFTRNLITTPSYSLGEAAVAKRVQDLLERLAYDQVFSDDAGNVVGVMIGSEPGPTVLLNSHMDTVAPDEGAWEDEYLWGRVEDNRIFGLGAADCKGGLAAQIFAGHILAKSGLPLRGDVVVAATVAEENGCSVGMRHLIEDTLSRLGMRPEYAVLGEPTNLSLCYGHDGWVRLECLISGEEMHSVRQAATLVLQDIKEASGAINGRASSRLRACDPEWLAGPGARALIRISRPIFPGEDTDLCIDQVRGRARKAAEPITGIAIEVDLHAERQKFFTGKSVDVCCRTEPWITDPFQPLFDRVREALRVAGWSSVPLGTWDLDRLEMGTAGSLLARECRIPTFGYGPGEVAQAHAPNESLSIDNLVDAAAGTAVLVHGLIGAPLQALAH